MVSVLRSTLEMHGCLVPAKRGRPAIYQTDEERKAALREQQRICRRRYTQRIKEACQRLASQADVEAENSCDTIK